MGVGVLVGSNGFNLAAMIGLSGLLAGRVRLAREVLLLEGMVGLLITLLAGGMLVGGLSPAVTAAVSALVLIPYLVLVIAGGSLLERRRSRARPVAGRRPCAWPAPCTSIPGPERPPDHTGQPHAPPAGADRVRPRADRGRKRRHGADRAHPGRGLACLRTRCSVSLILGPLTSLPNAATAVRLGRAGRGAALVGETFNSNTINLTAGVIVPALLVTLSAVSTLAKLQLAWLVAATLLTLGLLARPGGMRRAGALALIVLYFAFVVGTLVGA